VNERGISRLEKLCWAPWLRFSGAEFASQHRLYPAGQLRIRRRSQIVAALSCTRVNWDGRSSSLPTWDALAAPGNTFADRFVSDGNTLAMLSMSVDPEARGEGCAAELLQDAKRLAGYSDITWLVGDYRPSAYAGAKREGALFEEYSRARRGDGSLVDPWLRAIERAGLEFVRIDPRAMVCHATLEQVDGWRRSYRPRDWYLVSDEVLRNSLVAEHLPMQSGVEPSEIWECGETGSWYVDRVVGNAVYIESNYWARSRVVAQVDGSNVAPRLSGSAT
jgi:GNAT superfamily N-acetyltransferase